MMMMMMMMAMMIIVVEILNFFIREEWFIFFVKEVGPDLYELTVIIRVSPQQPCE